MIRRARFSVFVTPFVMLAAAACNTPPPAGDPTPTPTPTSDAASAPDASTPAPRMSAVLSPSATASSSATVDPLPAPTVSDTFTTPAGELTVTPIHHATLLLRVGGKAIYFDPVSTRASYEGLPKADYIFITDIHPDHLDAPGIANIKKDDTVLVGPPAVNDKQAVGVVMKNGDTHDFGLFKVEAVPMYNLVRGPDKGKLYHDKGRGDGFVLTFGKAGAKDAKTDAGSSATRFYVSGDTECTPEMKGLKNIDVAFVCMNLPYTMPPAEAATCINAFKPKVVFPFHYQGSNLDELTSAVKPESGIDVRKRTWY